LRRLAFWFFPASRQGSDIDENFILKTGHFLIAQPNTPFKEFEIASKTEIGLPAI
jgi:hypothetical protein